MNTERMKKANACHDRGFNCSQSVLAAFADVTGLSQEESFRIAAGFGRGAGTGEICGALSGAMMVLGAMGYGEKEAAALIRQYREDHGATDCATLLKASHDRGEPRKAHCDGLVYEMAEALDRIISQRSEA